LAVARRRARGVEGEEEEEGEATEEEGSGRELVTVLDADSANWSSCGVARETVTKMHTSATLR